MSGSPSALLRVRRTFPEGTKDPPHGSGSELGLCQRVRGTGLSDAGFEPLEEMHFLYTPPPVARFPDPGHLA